MNPQNVTDMLEPLRDPAAVGWWPPAPGWWLLALLLLIVLFLVLRLAWQAWLRGAPLRGARQELARIAASDAVAVERATALTQLQRRVAIAVAGDAAARDSPVPTGSSFSTAWPAPIHHASIRRSRPSRTVR
jgi:hypothetical protein